MAVYCSMCDKGFTRKDSLRRHKLTVHNKIDEADLRLKCGLCNERIPNKGKHKCNVESESDVDVKYEGEYSNKRNKRVADSNVDRDSKRSKQGIVESVESSVGNGDIPDGKKLGKKLFKVYEVIDENEEIGTEVDETETESDETEIKLENETELEETDATDTEEIEKDEVNIVPEIFELIETSDEVKKRFPNCDKLVTFKVRRGVNSNRRDIDILEGIYGYFIKKYSPKHCDKVGFKLLCLDIVGGFSEREVPPVTVSEWRTKCNLEFAMRRIGFCELISAHQVVICYKHISVNKNDGYL